MRREKAGRDFLIGSGLCLGACLFVQVAGTDMDKTQPAEGLFVQAGNKVVTGGAAVLPCILGTTGLVFLGRSVIEVFLPSAGSYESSQVQTTGELMAGGKLKAGQTLKLDTKNYSVEDLEREVLMFCVSII